MSTISVLITCHNESEYLDRSISSVLEQTHRPHEIVIVDAASDDGSRAIIDRYAETHPELVHPVLLSEDPGIPGMRNVALEHATGDLYTFLDGDDWFYPEKLERELEAYQNNPDVNLVYSNYEYVDERGVSRGTWVTEGHPPTGDVLIDVLTRNWPRGLWRSALIDITLIDTVGPYDEEMAIYEDWELKIRLAREATVAFCDEVLTVYRIHDQGVSSRFPAGEHVEYKNKILDKHRLSFADSSDPALRSASWEMRRVVWRHGVFAHTSEGNRLTALSMYLNLLWHHPTSIVDYKLHLNALLPRLIFEALLKLHDRLST